MKIFTIVLKVLAALAVVAGIAFVVIAYGDKIIAWVRKVLHLDCCCDCDCDCDDDCDNCQCQCDCETECPCDLEDAEDDEIIDTPVEADEKDFEG